MPKSKPVDLTRRESQMMEIVYRRRQATVEEIRAELPDAPSPSSVRKLLDIMMERGLLTREYRRSAICALPGGKAERCEPFRIETGAAHVLRQFSRFGDCGTDRHDADAALTG